MLSKAKDTIKLLNGGLKTTALTVLLGMYALTPLKFIEGDPTGLQLTFQFLYAKDKRNMVNWVIALDENQIKQQKDRVEIERARYYYEVHQSIKPRKNEFDDKDEYLFELQQWKEESKEKRYKIEIEENKLQDREASRLRTIAQNPLMLAPEG